MSASFNSPGRWLSIIGIGEDGLVGLSDAARTLIAQASLVVGGRRHLDLVAGMTTGEAMVWPSPPQAGFSAILERRGQPVAVIATGDPFFYGIGSLLAGAVPPGEMICLPGVSAFSLAAARLGWALQDCALVTLHGRALERIVPAPAAARAGACAVMGRNDSRQIGRASRSPGFRRDTDNGV